MHPRVVSAIDRIGFDVSYRCNVYGKGGQSHFCSCSRYVFVCPSVRLPICPVACVYACVFDACMFARSIIVLKDQLAVVSRPSLSLSQDKTICDFSHTVYSSRTAMASSKVYPWMLLLRLIAIHFEYLLADCLVIPGPMTAALSQCRYVRCGDLYFAAAITR